MKHSVVAILVTIFLCFTTPAALNAQAAKQVAGKKSSAMLSAQFRTKAEEMLDCIDELSSIQRSSDSNYDAQDLKCMDKLKKLRREANSPTEKELADLLRSYYGQVGTCRLAAQVSSNEYSTCSEKETAARAEAIKKGHLRA